MPSSWPLKYDVDTWVQRIVDNAFIVLERKGMTVPSALARDAARSCSGTAVTGDTVRFSPDYTAEFAARYRAVHHFSPPTHFTLSSTAHAHHIVEADGQCRPILLRDLEEGARLVDALRERSVEGSAPGVPQDVPPVLQGLAQLVAGAKFSRSFPSYALRGSIEAEEFIAECYDILELPYPIGVHVVSPLRFEGQEIDIALHMLRRTPNATVHIGTMPIMGMTAPASILAGFAQALAEVLGAAMLFDALGARSLSLNVNLYAADMRTTAFIYGTPANLAINALEVNLNEWLKICISAKSFNAMSQRPDQQAAAQKAMCTGFMAALGKRTFSGAGSLSLDEVYSSAQLVIDCEIFGAIKRTFEIAEAAFDREHELLDVIVQNTDGNYLTDPFTAMFYPELQCDSELFPSRLLQQAAAAGTKDRLTRANEQAQRLLAEHDYRLDEAKARALEDVFRQSRIKLVES